MIAAPEQVVTVAELIAYLEGLQQTLPVTTYDDGMYSQLTALAVVDTPVSNASFHPQRRSLHIHGLGGEPLTVGQLIEGLRAVDETLPVSIRDDGGDYPPTPVMVEAGGHHRGRRFDQATLVV